MQLQRSPVAKRQRGLTFFGLLAWGVLILALVMVGVQAAPMYVEYFAIQKAVNRAQTGSTVSEVQGIFDRAAQIDSITSVRGSDLSITKQGEKVVVGFDYSREIHLLGNAYLTLKYAGQSN